jgi:hypothetical protein
LYPRPSGTLFAPRDTAIGQCALGGLELLREAGNSAGIATFVAGEDWDSGSRNLLEPGKNIITLFLSKFKYILLFCTRLHVHYH